MLIDIHTHAYRVKPPFGPGFCTLPELLREQEKLGINMSVVMPIVSPEIYMPQTNDDILDMAREYPDRIIPFCNVDPRSMSNSPFAKFEQVFEYYKSLGCRGIGEVMPNMRMDDPKVQNLFRAAETVGMSVTCDGSDQLDGDFGLYDDPGLPQLEMTLRRFPKLKMFGHGPVFWSEIARLETPGERGVPFRFLDEGQVDGLANAMLPIKEEGVVPKLLRRYPNLLCDLADGTARNALARDLEFTEAFVREFDDRMYFGTDCCFPGMPVKLIGDLEDWLKRGIISKSSYNKITHENAMAFLGL